MTRAVLFVGLALAGAGLASACKKPADHACGKDPKLGCLCRTEPYRLYAGEHPVESCGEPASNLLQYRCCRDLDSAGESTECRCESAACVSAGDRCSCEMRTRVGEVGNIVPFCEARPSKAIRCCKRADECVCNEQACTNGSVVERCTANDVKAGACIAPVSHEVKSCDAVKWKRKT